MTLAAIPAGNRKTVASKGAPTTPQLSQAHRWVEWQQHSREYGNSFCNGCYLRVLSVFARYSHARDSQGSDEDMPFQVLHGPARQTNPVVADLADDLAAAPGELEAPDPLAAQPFGPVGRQCTMRGAGDRVFRHTHGGGEESGDEIG